MRSGSRIITIAPRFQGPPDSGNGGYVAGLLSRDIDGPATVRLRLPSPLNVPLEVHPTDDGALLVHGDRVIAEARPTEIDLQPPDPPTVAEAEEAGRSFRGFDFHPFAYCYVCGPRREPGDGLRIFPGVVPARDLVACTWLPDPSLDDGSGAVAREHLWAALDCPGVFAFPQPVDRFVLLGELAVAQRRAVRIGERYVIVGWQFAHEGRKHHTGSAVFSASGTCHGIGRATWIEIHPSQLA